MDEDSRPRADEITIPVQVNGKLRDRLVVPADVSEEDIKSAALASEIVQKYLEGKTPKKGDRGAEETGQYSGVTV